MQTLFYIAKPFVLLVMLVSVVAAIPFLAASLVLMGPLQLCNSLLRRMNG